MQALDAAGAEMWLKSAARRTPQEVLLEPQLVMPVTTTVVLERSEAHIASNKLRPMFAVSGPAPLAIRFKVTGPRSLEITGVQCDVARAIMFLGAADTVEPPVAR